MLDHPNPSTRSLSQLLGKLNATNPAPQMAPLLCRSLQSCLKTSTRDQLSGLQLNHPVIPPGTGRSTVVGGPLIQVKRESLIIQQSSMTIMSDASLQGWRLYTMGYGPQILGPLMNRLSTSITWSSWQ